MQPPLSPWWFLVFAVPTLFVGEAVVRRFPILARFNVPTAVVGGLLFATLMLALTSVAGIAVTLETKTRAGIWTWLVTPDSEWATRPLKSFNLPLLVGFFTCVGLGAPVRILWRGGTALLILLGGATILAVLQNGLGVALAGMLHAPPLLGVICGALTLVGGHGTALGFASRFEEAGFPAAATVGAAAATFALVAGGLVSGPAGELLLRRREAAKQAPSRDHALERGSPGVANFTADIRALAGSGRAAAGHLLLVAACIKTGAWLSFGLERAGASLPAYMGALLVGFGLRAVHDVTGGTWLRPEVVGRIGAVLLPLFLVVTLSALKLGDLASLALPMLVILCANIVLTILFAAAIVWPLLGRDHEAGVMVAGLLGFTVGSTATAVAAMDAMVRRRGPAPRAIALIPPIGGFLIDLTNAPVIALFLRMLR